MASTPLLHKIRSDFPTLSIVITDGPSRWTPSTQTISLSSATNDQELLHELGHALCEHDSYDHDVRLLAMEREAWEAAREYAEANQIDFDSSYAHAHLDTYRDWLHARSLCPSCGQTGLQESGAIYRCIECHTRWRVNDARTCHLRRRILAN